VSERDYCEEQKELGRLQLELLRRAVDCANNGQGEEAERLRAESRALRSLEQGAAMISLLTEIRDLLREGRR